MTPAGQLGAAAVAAPNGQLALAETSATPGAGADFFAMVVQLLAGPTLGGTPPGGEPATVPNDGSVADAPQARVGGGSAAVPGSATVADAPLPGEPDADQPAASDQPTGPVVDPATLTGLPIALLQAISALTPKVSVPGSHPEVDASKPGEPGSGPVDAIAPHPTTGSTHDPVTGTAPTPAAATPAPAATEGGSQTATPQAQPLQPTPTAALTAVPLLTTTPATTATTRPVTSPAPVTHQVLDEIVRVAGTGAGPRRVTVRLQPEALGEVRVVMTVRDGALRVSLAAGGAAHHTLLEGAPELQRLLEGAGSAGARVVVRDLPGAQVAAAPPTSAPQQGTTPDPGLGAGWGGPGAGNPGQDRTPERRTPRHGRTTATDGTHDPANPPRRTESVTRTRTAGVDVTM